MYCLLLTKAADWDGWKISHYDLQSIIIENNTLYYLHFGQRKAPEKENQPGSWF